MRNKCVKSSLLCVLLFLSTPSTWDIWYYICTTVTGSNFKATFVLEKHMAEDDVLFTNHLVGK